ncbi:hypothetical protein F2Q68_00045358 [Brassica cretica]|uniref:Uncharacterized protein n=1 Tax=Brassica cretica TaxID=69181 RepID=A0A8S9PQV2_BRACR|nr:hypothetical protein F2Q68_00045358 [Brassica cretica]KAF3523658.1 hypothetical protein F2Q69_00049998 [Brassica cretica]
MNPKPNTHPVPFVTRSQPATSDRLSSIPKQDLSQLAIDDSILLAIAACFPLAVRRSQLQLAFPIPARTARDPFQL